MSPSSETKSAPVCVCIHFLICLYCVKDPLSVFFCHYGWKMKNLEFSANISGLIPS